MLLDKQDIAIFSITLILLLAINYFRQPVFRYNLIAVYMLFALFIYMTIDKRYSIAILTIFILNYMFFAKKPVLEHFNRGGHIEEEPEENPQLMGIEEDVDTQGEEEQQEEEVDTEIEEDRTDVEEDPEYEETYKRMKRDNVVEDEEDGIEKFDTGDKFAKLHDLLHTLSKQVAKAKK